MIVKYVVGIILFSAPFSLISQITMTGPSQIKSNWPISANYCLNGHSSGSSYTWTTSSGIFTATQFGGTGPSSTYTNTNTCNLIETYYWTNYSPGSITVSAAGASKTTTVIPEDYSMNIQSLSIEQRTHCPSDSIIVAQVSKSYNLQPSGLLRCGPSGDCALLGHKWYLKRPNTAWIAIATVPSIPNISYTSIPSNQVNQFMLSQAGKNQPIYDSTHWSSGLISLDLSHIDYLPSGSEIYLEVQRFQGSVINSDTLSLNIISLPNRAVSASQTLFCSDDSATIAAAGGYDYLWNTGDTTQSITVNLSGTYYALLTDSNNCSATSSKKDITVVPDIVLPQIWVFGAITSNGLGWVTAGSTTGFSVAVDTNYTYQWGIQGGSIQFGQGTGNIAALWGIPGSNAAVWVVISNGVCSDSVGISINISGIGTDEGALQNVHLFPNPNDGYFTIEVGEAFVGASYEIVDGMGRPIERGEIQSQTQAFDLADKPKGVYRIALTKNDKRKTLMVVIQ